VITYAQAVDLVNRELSRWVRSSADEVVIVDANTIERDFGWVFRYESKRYFETRNIKDCLHGNGPIIVDRHTGHIRRFSSGISSQEAIREYEAELRRGGSAEFA
jgi:hypothetical protein